MVALYQLIKQFETQFASIARQILEEDQRADDNMTPVGAGITTGGWMVVHDLGANGIVKHRIHPGLIVIRCHKFNYTELYLP